MMGTFFISIAIGWLAAELGASVLIAVIATLVPLTDASAAAWSGAGVLGTVVAAASVEIGYGIGVIGMLLARVLIAKWATIR
jgi:uncharacterized membrane protein (DUF485 family)